MRIYGIVPKTITYYGKDVRVVLLGENERGGRLVYVPFQGEFLRDAADYEIVINETPVIIRTGTPTEGWIALLPGNGTPASTKYGTVYVLKDYVKNVELIECGYGVDMDTEQIGNWWQYLVIVREPTIFLVRMACDTDKKERYYVIFKDKKVHKVYSEELSLVKNTLKLYDLKDPDKLIKAYKGGDRETLVELKELKKAVSDKEGTV